jgi:hypothetical protein
MLEKFKEQIFELIAADTGSNIKPTQDEINAINSAETYNDARAVALQAGWSTYVSLFEKNNPSDETPDNIFVGFDPSQLGYQSDPFIGVDSETPITYKGEKTTVGEYKDNFYQDGDENFGFVNLSPNKIIDLQVQLVNAGLLGPKAGKPFRPGVWQRGVEGKIMYDIMAQANTVGIGKEESGWENILESYIQNPVSIPTQPDPYLPPDYQSVVGSINNTFKEQLGRDPMPYELKLLANTYMTESEKAYNQDVMLLQEAQKDVVATPENLNDYGNHTQAEYIKEKGLTQIDPSAALYDKFQQITAEERERLKDYGDIQATNNIILNSITGSPR